MYVYLQNISKNDPHPMTPLISSGKSTAVNAFHCIWQEENVDHGEGGVCRTEKQICRKCSRTNRSFKHGTHTYYGAHLTPSALAAFLALRFSGDGGAARTPMLRSRVKVTVPAWPNLSLLQPPEPSPEMEALLSQPPPPPLLLLGESASQKFTCTEKTKVKLYTEHPPRSASSRCEAISRMARVANPLHSLRVAITLQPEEKKTTQLVFSPSRSLLMTLWLC